MGKIPLIDYRLAGWQYFPVQDIKFFDIYPLGIFNLVSTIYTFLYFYDPISFIGYFFCYTGYIADCVFNYFFGSSTFFENSFSISS